LVCTLPLTLVAESAPPGCKPRLLFGSLARADFQIGRFHPRGVQRASPGLRHCFRSLRAGVVRPRPVVCTLPLIRFGRISAPWSQAQAPVRVSGSSRFSNRPLSPSRGPESVSRPMTLLSLAEGWCHPPASCGLHATPDPFRPNQCPLVISPGTRESILSAVKFPRVRFSISLARLSPCGSQLACGPVTSSSVVTRRVLRSARYPCWLWPQQRLLTAYPPVRNPDLHPNARIIQDHSFVGSGQVTKCQSRNAPACSVCRLPLTLSLVRAPLSG